MGEFHDAVSHLLDAFARGVSIIKTQRRRRKSIPIDPASMSAESLLSKTLKHNQVIVGDAYGKDFDRHGLAFAKGDAEAHSSLSSILLRLNAGFVSVIERFTRGLSTSADYQTLLSLSNTSRQEAIETFSQLSQRLSRSSLALVPSSPDIQTTHKRQTKKVSLPESRKYTRSKSTAERPIVITPLGLATPNGWVRPKSGRKNSSDSSKSSTTRSSSRSNITTTSKRSHTKPAAPHAPPVPEKLLVTPHKKSTISPPPVPHHSKPILLPTAPMSQFLELSPHMPPDYTKRKSIMSFASDSTKLGEIPEHKWAHRGATNAGAYPILTYHPLELYKEPEKPRSRLRKLFRR